MIAGLAILAAVPLLVSSGATASAATEDLGGGFLHHGVATPVSNHRGTVATVDGQGRNVVLVLLYDHRGGYALLLIDAATGRSEEYPMPFPPGGDGPYASILSSRNKFYTHFNSHFAEFDPAKRAFTFFHKTAPQMAMGMTEDDGGVIWSVTYPQSGVVSFNPATGEFKDYGHVYQQNWAQYQRDVAADDGGWIYFGIGSTASQIIAFDPRTGKATPVLPDEERAKGAASVYRDVDGKVYGRPAGAGDNWYEFHQGQFKKIGKHEPTRRKPIITGSQGLFHRDFPDGKKLQTCDLVDRVLVVEDPKTGDTRRLPFDYQSMGAHIMGLAAAPDGSICGGTAFPMRFFSYHPKTDQWVHREAHGQWNTVARQGDRFFVGGYGGGFLLEWDPSREWVATVEGNDASNPRFLTQCSPTINRPHDLLAHPDGKTLVLAGTPGYGYTGGGLLFWDRQTHARTLIEHTGILPEHSTESLVALPDGKLLGGTTTSPGTGGEKKAKEAELYVLDMGSKRLEWHEAVFPGVQGYTDLCLAPGGLVYGVADRTRFFVFDPAKRKVVHEENTQAKLGATNSQQGPRVFVLGPEGKVYMLFVKGIARVDPATFQIALLAESPVPIGPGGDILDGRIYFASGSHVYSFAIPGE
jgi:streptogramin lyase